MTTNLSTANEKLPVVALVGRTNVGKSTFFNKLIEERKALVSDIAGTTRNNNEGLVLWRGRNFRVIDTGGDDNDENEIFAADIAVQTEQALSRADVIIFVTDAKVGILPQERTYARIILKLARKGGKPVMLVANKCDKPKNLLATDGHEWLSLGLGEPMAISATTGRGVGDVLDAIHTTLGKTKKRPKVMKEPKPAIRVALIGKPNVGKSSLFNKLIGEDKVIVSPIAHTTREPFDTTLTYEDEKGKKHEITFIDTAGIRRKSKVSGVLESSGVQKSINAIDEANIILLVLDASEPVSSQDLQLGGLLEKHSKSVIVLINKWDLTDDTSDAHRNEVKAQLYKQFPHLEFAPVLLVSGKTGYRVHQIFPLLLEVEKARHTEIPDDELAEFMRQATREHRPARGKGTRHPTITRMRQINSAPPVFELFVKYRTSLHRSYLNFLERKLRETYNFIGAPIVIKLTKMKRI